MYNFLFLLLWFLNVKCLIMNFKVIFLFFLLEIFIFYFVYESNYSFKSFIIYIGDIISIFRLICVFIQLHINGLNIFITGLILFGSLLFDHYGPVHLNKSDMYLIFNLCAKMFFFDYCFFDCYLLFHTCYAICVYVIFKFIPIVVDILSFFVEILFCGLGFYMLHRNSKNDIFFDMVLAFTLLFIYFTRTCAYMIICYANLFMFQYFDITIFTIISSIVVVRKISNYMVSLNKLIKVFVKKCKGRFKKAESPTFVVAARFVGCNNGTGGSGDSKEVNLHGDHSNVHNDLNLLSHSDAESSNASVHTNIGSTPDASNASVRTNVRSTPDASNVSVVTNRSSVSEASNVSLLTNRSLSSRERVFRPFQGLPTIYDYNNYINSFAFVPIDLEELAADRLFSMQDRILSTSQEIVTTPEVSEIGEDRILSTSQEINPSPEVSEVDMDTSSDSIPSLERRPPSSSTPHPPLSNM